MWVHITVAHSCAAKAACSGFRIEVSFHDTRYGMLVIYIR